MGARKTVIVTRMVDRPTSCGDPTAYLRRRGRAPFPASEGFEFRPAAPRSRGPPEPGSLERVRD